MLEAFLYRHDFCSKGLRLELWRLRQSHTHPTGIVLCIPSFDTIFIDETGTTALRRTAWHEISWLHSGGVAYPFASSLFFLLLLFLVIRGDETTVVGANYGYLGFPSGFLMLMLLQCVTSSMLHPISMHVESCWFMSISCLWNILIFVFTCFSL